MPFTARLAMFPVPGEDETPVVVLADEESGARAEIWPACGFNCFRWTVSRNEKQIYLLHSDASFFFERKASAYGHPILFPFPNRIRDGRFTFQGKKYQVPINDGPKVNAIHGFVYNRAWDVVDGGDDETSAWVTGRFRGSTHAADVKKCWPADYELFVTYVLRATSLRVEAIVRNPGKKPLPFGLGYHPYFRVPIVSDTSATDCLVQAHAQQIWELKDSLPTGKLLTPTPDLDLSEPQWFEELKLDDVFTGLNGPTDSDDLRLLAKIRQPSVRTELRVSASQDFRELVVYTPPHREAICLEPYTCTPDAVKLEAQGIDSGWKVLAPGEVWRGDVVYDLHFQGTAGSGITTRKNDASSPESPEETGIREDPQ